MSSEVPGKEPPLCKILQIGSAFLIWNSEDAQKLRERRIVGALTGIRPAATQQNEQSALPMKLMFEQVLFLKSRELAEVIKYKNDMILPKNEEYRKSYEEWMKSEIERQSIESHKKTIDIRLGYAKQIACGRKTKTSNLNDDGSPKKKIPKSDSDQSQIDVTPEEIAQMEEEIRNTPVRLLKENEWIKETWTDSPLFNNGEQYELVETDFKPRNEIEKLRYAVFSDLWEKGYFLTDGLKFGGDFLAYPGDPLLYHASHIIVCLPDAIDYDSTDLAAWCRLGSQVKKIVLLCSWNETDKSKIDYKSITWKRID